MAERSGAEDPSPPDDVPLAEGSSDFLYEGVMVVYFSRPHVVELLKILPADLPLAIVDNSKGRDQVEELFSGRPNCRYQYGAGEGFAKAANLAARASTYDYLVFINPDSRPSVDVLNALVDDLVNDPGLVATAAATTEPGGRIEFGSGGWEPTVRRAITHMLGLHKIFPKAGLWARPTPSKPINLDWLNGACLAVRKSAFLELGGFDERYFVYNEDMSFGRRVRLSGRRQRLRTDLLVPHAGGSSGGDKNAMMRMRGAAMVDYLRHHNPATQAAVMRLALVLGSTLRLAVFSVWRFHHSGRSGQERAYLAGLLWGRGDAFNT